MSIILENNTESSMINPVIKGRGRPKGSLNVIPAVYARRPKDDCVKKRGRPRKYGDSDAKYCYNRRGVFINKILFMKRKYGLQCPTKDEYIGKNEEDLIDIIVKMGSEVNMIKCINRLNKMTQMKESIPNNTTEN
jgi:hypothetical protein